MLTAFLQFIDEHDSATGKDQVIVLRLLSKCLLSLELRRAVSAALDRNQPTTKVSKGHLNNGENPAFSPLTDRSSCIGPIHGVEPKALNPKPPPQGLGRLGIYGSTGPGSIAVEGVLNW